MTAAPWRLAVEGLRAHGDRLAVEGVAEPLSYRRLAGRAEAVADATVEARLQGVAPRAEPYDVPVRALYKVHQRVAGTYRKGRAFLAGDAAHLNNPLGGMGLNGGLHDAVDLAGRIDRVWHGRAADGLLDGYEKNRKPLVVNAILAQTARNKRLLEERDPAVRAQTLEQWRRMAADPGLAYEHMLQTSMIGPLRQAQAAGNMGPELTAFVEQRIRQLN